MTNTRWLIGFFPIFMLFGLLTALKICIILFGAIPRNSQVGDYKRLREISCLFLEDRSEGDLLKRW
jgi:hypothetical protein